jgi:hypothetical protein
MVAQPEEAEGKDQRDKPPDNREAKPAGGGWDGFAPAGSFGEKGRHERIRK